MVDKLVPGVFEDLSGDLARAFGLKAYAVDGVMWSAGWFNGKGERLRRAGDLSAENFRLIAEKLPPNEYFVIVNQRDMNPARVAKTNLQAFQFVIADAEWVICPGQVYRVMRYSKRNGDANWCGIAYRRISASTAESLLTANLIVGLTPVSGQSNNPRRLG